MDKFTEGFLEYTEDQGIPIETTAKLLGIAKLAMDLARPAFRKGYIDVLDKYAQPAPPATPAGAKPAALHVGAPAAPIPAVGAQAAATTTTKPSALPVGSNQWVLEAYGDSEELAKRQKLYEWRVRTGMQDPSLPPPAPPAPPQNPVMEWADYQKLLPTDARQHVEYQRWLALRRNGLAVPRVVEQRQRTAYPRE